MGETLKDKRDRQISHDRAERARLALAPYLENDGPMSGLEEALLGFLVDLLHYSARSGELKAEDLKRIVDQAVDIHSGETVATLPPAVF